MNRNTILITGGCGFLGQHITKKIIEQGHRVVILDISKPNFSFPGVHYVEGDVRDDKIVRDCVSQCDLVIHAAAVVGVEAYLKKPEEVIDVNVNGTKVTLKTSLEYGKPVLLISSSEVYGNNCLDLDEETVGVYGPPSQSRWCYAVSKAASEHLAFGLGAKGLRFVIVRYFNIYGPGMTNKEGGRVLRRFLNAIREERAILLIDGGNAIRCFCYISDAVDGTLFLLKALYKENPAVLGHAFNIGTVEPVSIRELAERLICLTGHRAGVKVVNGQSIFGKGYKDIERRVPDVTAIEKSVGFRSSVSLDEGLRKTLDSEGLLRITEAQITQPFIPWIRPNFNPDSELMNNFRKLLQSGHVTNDGPTVVAFESEVACYLGVNNVIVVSSGSHALLLSAYALGCTGRAILPSFSFIATLSALIHTNLKPVFCDVDIARWTMSLDHLKILLREYQDVSLVVPVNSYGVPPDIEAILSTVLPYGVKVLYDDAHGFGSEIKGYRNYPGVYIRTISLHATKVLPAIEGGLIICEDRMIADRIRQLRSHGLTLTLESSTPGFNSRMDELRAAIGRHSLWNFDKILFQRRHYAQRLRTFIEHHCHNFFINQQIPEDIVSNYTNLAVRIPNAEVIGMQSIITQFHQLGIETRRYFYPALHKLDYFKGRKQVELPVTECLSQTLLCLPLYSYMAESELRRIEFALTNVAQKFSL